MNLTVTDLPLGGLKRVTRALRSDERGRFSRLFCAQELARFGWDTPVVQINHSWTQPRGTVRGLHYQALPHAEMKLVSCIRGEVWDVAVDLRANSPTFLQWHAERLNAEEGAAILIPEGFAHGFQVLSDEADLIYCHSSPYTPEAERGLHIQDPRLHIRWPAPLGHISERDAAFPALPPDFQGVQL